MSIGEVLDHLRQEFSDVTISKIRFLEAEGLVDPRRTPSGYRKFSHADVERLRYVLTAQRDHYLPLRVIKEHLDAMDRGLDPPALPGGEPVVPRVVLAGDDYLKPEAFASEGSSLRLSREELREAAGITDELLTELVGYGLVAPRSGGRYFDGDAVTVAKIAVEMAGYGLEPRHLRTFKSAADRQVGLFEQVVAPVVRHRGAESQARAEEVTRQLAALSVRLYAALVKLGLHADR